MTAKEVLKEYRDRKGLSQIELAEELDVSRQTVARWESGTVPPSKANLRRISQVCGVPLEELLNSGSSEAAHEGTPPAEAGPTQVPVRRKRLWSCALAALAAAVLIVAAVFFHSYFVDRPAPDGDIIPVGQIEGEVMPPIKGTIPLLPLDDE